MPTYYIVTLKQKWPKSFFGENELGIPLDPKFDFAFAYGGWKIINKGAIGL